MNQLEELVTSDTGIEFKLEDLRPMLGWGVYAYFDDLGCLYVGMSEGVLHRALSKHNRQARNAREESTLLRMWSCPSKQAASDLEELLIGKWRPRYNHRKGYQALASTLGVGLAATKRLASAVVKTRKSAELAG